MQNVSPVDVGIKYLLQGCVTVLADILKLF